MVKYSKFQIMNSDNENLRCNFISAQLFIARYGFQAPCIDKWKKREEWSQDKLSKQGGECKFTTKKRIDSFQPFAAYSFQPKKAVEST